MKKDVVEARLEDSTSTHALGNWRRKGADEKNKGESKSLSKRPERLERKFTHMLIL